MDPISVKDAFNKVKGVAGKVPFKTIGTYYGLAKSGYMIYDVGRQVAQEDGNFIDTDPDDGSWRVGHKGERLIAGTAKATPGLVWNGVNAYRYFAGTNSVAS